MDNSNGVLLIDKEQFYKTYIEQREKLHFNLAQQLIARAEAKKQHILNKSNEIIETFNQYRDQFLGSMPNEFKSLKVSEYLNKSQGSLEGLIQHSHDETMHSLYKILQSECEKVNQSIKKSVRKINTNQQIDNKLDILNQEKNKAFEGSEADETVLEFIDCIKEKQPSPKKVTKTKPVIIDANKHSAMKSKPKIEATTPVKSNRKRKWDQFTSNGKENRTPNATKGKTNGGNKAETGKILNLEKNTPVLALLSSNKDVSPSKRPWMP